MLLSRKYATTMDPQVKSIVPCGSGCSFGVWLVCGGLSPFSGTRSIGMSTFAVFHGASENQGHSQPSTDVWICTQPIKSVSKKTGSTTYLFVTGIQQSSIYNGFYMLLTPIDDSNPSKRISSHWRWSSQRIILNPQCQTTCQLPSGNQPWQWKIAAFIDDCFQL